MTLNAFIEKFKRDRGRSPSVSFIGLGISNLAMARGLSAVNITVRDRKILDREAHFSINAARTIEGEGYLDAIDEDILVLSPSIRRDIPEITAGTVLVKSVAREAGSRTKIAVFSRDPEVDAVGACIGNRGMRIGSIVEELRGEKIDVIQYSEKPEEFIAAALSPAEALSVEFDGERSATVQVSGDQLSLAIGKEGQNVRLAAKLTGCKIDIKGVKPN